MRRTPSLRCRLLLLFTALAGLLGLVAAGPAAAFVMAPGDNGDVKIHASTTPVDDTRNEPKVCVFYLDAFNFDGLQQVSWHIDQQPPTGTAQVLSGAITLDHSGNGHTGDMTLPDGHYKMSWHFVGEHGRDKFKVFKVDCTGTPPPTPSTSSSASASASASASESVPASPSASESGTAGPSASSSAKPGKGKLAATGGEAMGWLALGGAALAAGAALVRQARRPMRHR